MIPEEKNQDEEESRHVGGIGRKQKVRDERKVMPLDRT